VRIHGRIQITVRISALHITNFRAIKEFHLENIPDLVVLAGPNGTGKSTVLEAIALWKEATAPYYSTLNVGPDVVSQGAERAEIAITLELRDEEAAFGRREMERRGLGVDGVELKHFSSTLEISPAGSVALWQDARPGYSVLQELIREFDLTRPLGIMEYIGPYRRLPTTEIQSIPLTPITFDREKITRIYDIESKFNEVKAYLIALQVKIWELHSEGKGGEDPLQQIRKLFEIFFSPKRFIGAKTMETPQGRQLKLLVETPSGTHDIDKLSSGEKEILMVFATLQRLRLSNSIILYDEPELHLNSALERKVIPELRTLGVGNQIWVTTHSVDIIDSTPLENLFVMSHYSGGNQVRRTETDREQINLFRSLGATTGLQLISERVVFIEGEDSSVDKEMLEEVFADHRHQVSFVPVGGVSNLEWVGRRGVDLWQEASRNGQFFLVRDRDFLSKDQANDLQKELQGRVWVWSRYHIENFLLDGEAILRALKRAGVDEFSNADDVEAELKSVADSLREETIARWVGADLNMEFGREDFRITGGTDPVSQLVAKAKAASKRITERLTPEKLKDLVEEKRSAIKASDDEEASDDAATWDDGLWRKYVPGRRLLSEFVGRLGVGLSYEQLRSLVFAEMKDDRTLFPEEFKKLAEAVLEGLD